MALAELTTSIDDQLGERRWAEWWAVASHDPVFGAALLGVYDAWDGDRSIVTPSVYEQFRALARRLAAYEDWCAQLGIAPARRPVSLRLVEGQADERRLCGDCRGAGIDVDFDGSLSGQVGALVDCGCADVPALGFGVMEVCSAMLGRPLAGAERSVALMVEYLAHCRARGVESAWCLSCGAYVADLDACPCGG